MHQGEGRVVGRLRLGSRARRVEVSDTLAAVGLSSRWIGVTGRASIGLTAPMITGPIFEEHSSPPSAGLNYLCAHSSSSTRRVAPGSATAKGDDNAELFLTEIFRCQNAAHDDNPARSTNGMSRPGRRVTLKVLVHVWLVGLGLVIP